MTEQQQSRLEDFEFSFANVKFSYLFNCLLISWLQSPHAVILEPPKMKSDTVSTVSLSISHEVMGPDAMDLHFLNVEL